MVKRIECRIACLLTATALAAIPFGALERCDATPIPLPGPAEAMPITLPNHR